MRLNRMVSRFTALMVMLAVTSVSVLPGGAVSVAQAQSGTPLVVSLPSLWEDTVTPDMLAPFEAQYGVDVITIFTDTAFFGFGPGGTDIEESLDATEDAVNAADVLYVDQTSLTAADTQAGYYLDLAPLVMSDPAMDVADFVPAAWESYQWDNGMWALPLSMDVIVLTYDPAAFDAVGLAYPNERWTVDDFANAARLLSTYNSDGTVDTVGFSTVSGGNNFTTFARALSSSGFYDASTVPNAPSFSDPNLEYTLDVLYDLSQEGVILLQGGGRDSDVPLTIGGINSYAARGFRPGQDEEEMVRYATLLPGGTAGLSVEGFAVSAGTMYPELAYALASFLTQQPALANNAFSAAPARLSLDGVEVTTNNTDNNGGPGGGPGGPGGFNRTIPDAIQPTIDQAVYVALPVSELRYASYLDSALRDMNENGTDARSALQVSEADAVSDMETAMARYGNVYLAVVPPAAAAPLAPGKISLTCAVNLGIGGRMRGSELPSQTEWDQLIADFVATDPVVGEVVLESVQESDLATLAESYDCIILPTNAVQSGDLSMILNLDPLIDTDVNFDRNDVIGNTLAQLQQDNKTWALPLAIQPQMLEYDANLFAQYGVPEPLDGWTTDEFTDALRMLRPYDTDSAGFAPNDPSGSYMLMLLAAYGGLPFDYRTDPATVNLTDPTTVDAIRQVLDLAKEGYIAYSPLGNLEGALTGLTDYSAITTNTMSRFNFGPPGGGPGGPGGQVVDTRMVLYPQGSMYSAISYEITTGYISTLAQNPEAAYRFLSAVASSPQLFDGMPARQSLIYDPVVVAAQGEEIVAVYQQLDTLLSDPNTIIFPTFTAGGPRAGLTFIEQYWLSRAMDRYVYEDADLEFELSEAQMFSTAYRECTASFEADTTTTTQDQQFQQFQQIMSCATSVDPTFDMGF